jgi:transcriptional regulator with XRE-family HTH domain
MDMALTAAVKKELGLRLKARRLALGLPAGVVARDALGYSTPNHAAITRLERGECNRISRDQLQRLAAFFRTGLEELLPPGASLDQLEDESPPPPLPAAVAPVEPAQPARSSATPDSAAALVVKLSGVTSVQGRFQALRASLGMSQAQFAAKLAATSGLDISERDVRDWEHAARRPTLEQFEAIEQATGMTVGWLKTGRKAPSRGPAALRYR